MFLVKHYWLNLPPATQPQVNQTQTHRGPSDFEQSSEEDKPTSQSHVTTTFTEDSNRTIQDFSTMSITDDIVVKDQSLSDFLAKPYYVGTIDWTTSHTSNTDIANYNITSLLTGTTAWSNKISGYQLFRGTPVFTIVLNANPFQQGKIYLNYMPCDAQFTAKDLSYTPVHRTLLSSKRMLPGVEIDCRDSGAVFKIPYITPANWYAQKGLYGYGFGSIWLTVLSPLLTGASGESDVNISIYLHFEDAEFAAPIVPQSNVSKKKYTAKVINKEDKELSTGQVSNALSLASKVASSLSTIPLLSDIMTPISWSLRGLSGVASYFGWSKAQINSLPMHVSRQFQHYAATSDGSDAAYPISLISDNRVSIMPENSIVDSDEMSFDYLKPISTIVGSVQWQTSSTASTTLYSLDVVPTSLCETSSKVITPHTTLFSVGPPVFYLSNFFTYYRGGIKVTFKFPKTEFHSGRLMVTFTPTSNTVYTAPTLSTATLALREIIDIRCGSEFTFTLPYLLERNYTNTNDPLGALHVIVLNELRCPETASPTINMLIYYSAADDFELQAFNNAGILAAPFSPQMDCKELVNEVIGNVTVPKVNLKYALQSFGESFSSVKQLLNRNTTMLYSSTTISGSAVEIFPYAAGLMSMNAVTGVLQGPIFGGDVFSAMLGMYAFYRGGVRLVVTPGTDAIVVGSTRIYSNNNIPVLLNSSNTPYNQGPSTWIGAPNTTTVKTMFSGVVQTDNNMGLHSFDIPYYCPAKVSLALYQPYDTSYGGVGYEGSQPAAGLILDAVAGDFTNSGFSRSFKDDFVFSYFLGCPPLMTAFS